MFGWGRRYTRKGLLQTMDTPPHVRVYCSLSAVIYSVLGTYIRLTDVGLCYYNIYIFYGFAFNGSNKEYENYFYFLLCRTIATRQSIENRQVNKIDFSARLLRVFRNNFIIIMYFTFLTNCITIPWFSSPFKNLLKHMRD